MKKYLLGLLAALSVCAGAAPKTETAIFAAGCFWCTQVPFDELPGVIKTTVGYTGGQEQNPTYQQVSSGSTGHAEALEVVYDPAKVGYEKLLDVFWQNIDPTTLDRQFPDSGKQYRTVIFYHTPAQQSAAIKSKELLDKSGRFSKKIVTAIEPAGVFWPAEEYHQKYYRKSPDSYKAYSENSGRKQFFKRIWGK